MSEKGMVAVIFATVLVTLYRVVGYTVPPGRVVRSLALPVDAWIPFVPATSWYDLNRRDLYRCGPHIT